MNPDALNREEAAAENERKYPEWIAATVDLFRYVAGRREFFTVDEVWDEWDRLLARLDRDGVTLLPQYIIPESNNMRVMGNAVSAAIRQGIIVKRYPSDDPRHPPETTVIAERPARRNNGNNPVYRSLIYRGSE